MNFRPSCSVDHDLIGAVDDVEVGQDDALGVDDEAGAEAERAVVRRLVAVVGLRLEEFAELVRDLRLFVVALRLVLGLLGLDGGLVRATRC